MASLEAVATLEGHTSRVWCVAWNPTGTLLASASGDASVRIWGRDPTHESQWRCHSVLNGQHSRTIRSVAWSPCGMFLATASFDGTSCIWDRRDGEFECVATLEGHENEVKAVAWSATGKLLATCSRDKTVWIWEIEDDAEQSDELELQCLSVLHTHTQDVKAVAWHPSTEILASASYDNTVRLYRDDPSDWLSFDTLTGHGSTVWKLAFDSTGGRMVTASDDQTVKVWRAYTPGNQQGVPTQGSDPKWKCVTTLSGYHDRAVYDVAWAADGRIATASGDNALRVFAEEAGSDEHAPSFSLAASLADAHSEDINSVAWCPSDPAVLASGSDDGTIKLWRVPAVQ